MQLRVADEWWMAGLTAITGIVLLVVNVRSLPSSSDWTMSVLSTASAAFVAVLGLALLLERDETNV